MQRGRIKKKPPPQIYIYSSDEAHAVCIVRIYVACTLPSIRAHKSSATPPNLSFVSKQQTMADVVVVVEDRRRRF